MPVQVAYNKRKETLIIDIPLMLAIYNEGNLKHGTILKDYKEISKYTQNELKI